MTISSITATIDKIDHFITGDDDYLVITLGDGYISHLNIDKDEARRLIDFFIEELKIKNASSD